MSLAANPWLVDSLCCATKGRAVRGSMHPWLYRIITNHQLGCVPCSYGYLCIYIYIQISYIHLNIMATDWLTGAALKSSSSALFGMIRSHHQNSRARLKTNPPESLPVGPLGMDQGMKISLKVWIVIITLTHMHKDQKVISTIYESICAYTCIYIVVYIYIRNLCK